MIDHLVAGSPTVDVGADGFETLEVAPGVVLVTFRTDPRGSRPAWRSSLWRAGDRGWRLVHHQGTPLPVPPDPTTGAG